MSTFNRRNVENFLRSRGTERIAHPGGTLHQHLLRVADLLAGWGADERLQVAGLCHACYGTDGFDRVLLAWSERRVLADLIGAEAESLVYLYGSCDRGALYPTLRGDGPVLFRDRFTGDTGNAAEGDIRAFVELTAANELDVIRNNRAIAAKHGEALFELMSQMRPRISDAAWRAWTRELRAGEDSGRDPSPVTVSGLDHLVLTVADIDQTVKFYEEVLGMRSVIFGANRRALTFGTSKINLHRAGHEFAPHAATPIPGSSDLCLVTTASPQQVIDHLAAMCVAVVEGPVPRTGARGAITSVYVRDPDANLIEIASYSTRPAGRGH